MMREERTGTRTLVPKSSLRFGARFDWMFPIAYASAYAALGIFLQLRYFPIGDFDLESDWYGDLVIAARNLAEGRFSVADFVWKGPLYAFALVPVRWVTGDWYRGAVVLSALASGAYLLLAYRLVLRLFERRTAILSMVTASLVVELFVQSHRAATDVLFLALSLGSIACSALAGGSWRRHAFAGGLAALAFLTRYNGFFLIPGAALVLAVNSERSTRRKQVMSWVLYVSAFLLVCAPWFIASRVETGRFLATRNLENVIEGFYGGPRWQGDSVDEIQDVSTLVARDPKHIVTHYAGNLLEHATRMLSQLFGWPMALLPSLGLVGLVLRPPNRRQASLYLFALVYWLCMGIVFFKVRFFLPLILPSVVAGFSLLRSATIRSRIALAALAASMLVLASVQVRRIAAVERTIHARRPLYILEAARALARPMPAPGERRPRILARKGHIAYHAGFDFTPMSTNVGSLEELVRYARSVDAEYVAYSKIEYSMLPRLLFLAVTDPVPLLQEVYRGRSTRVFRLEDSRTVLSEEERVGLLRANVQAARTQGRPVALIIASDELGRHHLQNREFAEAARMFEQALEVAERAAGDPQAEQLAASARYNLAGAYMGLGRSEAAIPILKANLESFSKGDTPRVVAETHARLGRAYALLGRVEDAHRERTLAREIDPAIDAAASSESLQVFPRPK